MTPLTIQGIVSLLAFIPVGTFVLLFLHLTGLQLRAGRSQPSRSEALLKASLLWGACVVVVSEALGYFHLISRPWVAVAWAVLTLGVLFDGWRLQTFRPGVRRVFAADLRLSRGERIILIAMVGVVIGIFVTAWISPPNNTDSLQYHMSRVVHWAQNGSLDHYAATFHAQLWSPPWAEAAILNLRVLWGSDEPANLIQWFSMLGSLVGVAAVARELGTGRKGQLLAVAFAISIPMGILQASSTQTDYVTALWLICVAYFVVRARVPEVAGDNWKWLGLAFGVGILTKGTSYAFALPFAFWWTLEGLARRGVPQTLKSGLGIVAVVVSLNGCFWLRNLATYGGPLGSQEWVQNKTNIAYTPGRMIASIVNQVGLNFATPSEEINQRIVSSVHSISEALGAGPGPFRLIWSWNHEDLAGNPLHFLLIPLSLAGLALGSRIDKQKAIGYAAVAILAFVLFSSIASLDVYGARHHIPFLVALAPVVGVAGEALSRPRIVVAAAGCLVLFSFPWVLLNRSRPLVGAYPRTMTASILQEPPSAVLLANWPELRDPYVEVASSVRTSSCSEVGLRIDSHDLEYAFWWLLGAPQSGIRIEVVNPLQSIASLADPSFKPCAIICTICGGQQSLGGLPLKLDAGPALLFEAEQ